MDFLTRTAGEAHFTSQQFRSMIEAVVGNGSYIANLYEQLDAELADNNIIKIRSGLLIHHGGLYLIPEGTYDEVTYLNGNQAMQRIDLIVARYTKNAETGIETGDWVVIKGTPAEADPVVPEYTAGNMQDGDLIDECPLFEVHFDGLNVIEIKKIVKTIKALDNSLSSADVVDNLLSDAANLPVSAKQANLLYKNSLTFKGTLTAEDNLDNITENGIYLLQTGNMPSNCPVSNASYLEVFGKPDSNAKIQRVTRYGTEGVSWFRPCAGDGVWQEWVRYATSGDLETIGGYTNNTGSASTLASGTKKAMASITLEPGIYIIQASGQFNGGSTWDGYRNITISDTSGEVSASRGVSTQIAGAPSVQMVLQAHMFKILTSKTTYYCNMCQTSGESLQASGQIRAFRIA